MPPPHASRSCPHQENAAASDALRDAMVRKRAAVEAARAAEEKAKRLRAKSNRLNRIDSDEDSDQD